VTLPGAVERLLTASRAGNIAAMHELVDCELSNVGTMLRGLAGVDEPDREQVAQRGLADIEDCRRNGESGQRFLRSLAARLSTATALRPAAAQERDQALSILHTPAPPRGLSDRTSTTIRAMTSDAARIAEVFVADGPDGARMFLALAPGDRVAWIH
jgi:hypothetical protein